MSEEMNFTLVFDADVSKANEQIQNVSDGIDNLVYKFDEGITEINNKTSGAADEYLSGFKNVRKEAVDFQNELLYAKEHGREEYEKKYNRQYDGLIERGRNVTSKLNSTINDNQASIAATLKIIDSNMEHISRLGEKSRETMHEMRREYNAGVKTKTYGHVTEFGKTVSDINVGRDSRKISESLGVINAARREGNHSKDTLDFLSSFLVATSSDVLATDSFKAGVKAIRNNIQKRESITDAVVNTVLERSVAASLSNKAPTYIAPTWETEHKRAKFLTPKAMLEVQKWASENGAAYNLLEELNNGIGKQLFSRKSNGDLFFNGQISGGELLDPLEELLFSKFTKVASGLLKKKDIYNIDDKELQSRISTLDSSGTAAQLIDLAKRIQEFKTKFSTDDSEYGQHDRPHGEGINATGFVIENGAKPKKKQFAVDKITFGTGAPVSSKVMHGESALIKMINDIRRANGMSEYNEYDEIDDIRKIALEGLADDSEKDRNLYDKKMKVYNDPRFKTYGFHGFQQDTTQISKEIVELGKKQWAGFGKKYFRTDNFDPFYFSATDEQGRIKLPWLTKEEYDNLNEENKKDYAWQEKNNRYIKNGFTNYKSKFNDAWNKKDTPASPLNKTVKIRPEEYAILSEEEKNKYQKSEVDNDYVKKDMGTFILINEDEESIFGGKVSDGFMLLNPELAESRFRKGGAQIRGMDSLKGSAKFVDVAKLMENTGVKEIKDAFGKTWTFDELKDKQVNVIGLQSFKNAKLREELEAKGKGNENEEGITDVEKAARIKANKDRQEMLTAISRELPLMGATPYDYDKDAQSLGVQATKFLAPNVQRAIEQAEVYKQMIEAVNTQEGFDKYVGSKNGWLPKTPNGNYDMSNPQIIAERDKYVDDLIRKMNRGELIALNGERFAQSRIMKSATSMMYEKGLGDINMAAKWFSEHVSEGDLSAWGLLNSDGTINNDVLLNLITGQKDFEGNNIIMDFDNVDSIMPMAIRAPGESGQQVLGRNAAKILKPFFEAMGETNLSGVQVNAKSKEILAGADEDGDVAKMLMSELASGSGDVIKTLSKQGLLTGTAEQKKKALFDSIKKGSFTKEFGGALVAYDEAKYGRLVRTAIELIAAETERLNKEKIKDSELYGLNTAIKEDEVKKEKATEESDAEFIGDAKDAIEQSKQNKHARMTMGFASVAGMNSAGLKNSSSTISVYRKQQLANVIYDAGTTMQKKDTDLDEGANRELQSLTRLPNNHGTVEKIWRKALAVSVGDDGKFYLGDPNNSNEKSEIKKSDVLDLGDGTYAYIPLLHGVDYGKDEAADYGDNFMPTSRLAAITGYTEADDDINRFVSAAMNYDTIAPTEEDFERNKKIFSEVKGQDVMESTRYMYGYQPKNTISTANIEMNEKKPGSFGVRYNDKGELVFHNIVHGEKYLYNDNDLQNTKEHPFYEVDENGNIGYYYDKKSRTKIGIKKDFTFQPIDNDGRPSIGKLKRIIPGNFGLPAQFYEGRHHFEEEDLEKFDKAFNEDVYTTKDEKFQRIFFENGSQEILDEAYNIIAAGFGVDKPGKRLSITDKDIENLMQIAALYKAEMHDIAYRRISGQSLAEIYEKDDEHNNEMSRRKDYEKRLLQRNKKYNAIMSWIGQTDIGDGKVSLGISFTEKKNRTLAEVDKWKQTNGKKGISPEQAEKIFAGMKSSSIATEHDLDSVMEDLNSYREKLSKTIRNNWAAKDGQIEEIVAQMEADAYGLTPGTEGSIATYEEQANNKNGFKTMIRSETGRTLMNGLIHDAMRWANKTGLMNAINNRSNISPEEYEQAENIFKDYASSMGISNEEAGALIDIFSTNAVGGKKQAELLSAAAVKHGNNYDTSYLESTEKMYMDALMSRLKTQYESYDDIHDIEQQMEKAYAEGNQEKLYELDEKRKQLVQKDKDFASNQYVRIPSGNPSNPNNPNDDNEGIDYIQQLVKLTDIREAPARLKEITDSLYGKAKDLKGIQGIDVNQKVGYDKYFSSVFSNLLRGKIALKDPSFATDTKGLNALQSAIRIIEEERYDGQNAYIQSLLDSAGRSTEEFLYNNDFKNYKQTQLKNIRTLNEVKTLPLDILKGGALDIIKAGNFNFSTLEDKIKKDYEENNREALVEDLKLLRQQKGIKNTNGATTYFEEEIDRILAQSDEVNNRIVTEGTIAKKEKQNKASTEKYINDLLGGVSDFSYKYEKDKKNTNLATLFKKQSGNLKNIQSKRNTINSIIEDMRKDPERYSNFSEDEKKTLQDNLTKGLANADSMISELVNGTFTEDRMKTYTEAQDKDIEKIKKKFESKKVISAETKNNYIDKYQSKLEELQTIYNTTTDEGAKSMAETQIKKIDKFLEELKTKEAYQDESKVNFARSAMYDANLQAQKHSEWGFQSFRDYGNQYTVKEIQRNIQLLYSKRNERAQELRNQFAYEEGTEQWNASQAKIDAYDAEIEKLNDSLETLGKSLERDGSKLKRFGQDFASASKRFGQDLTKMGIQKATSMLQNYTKQAAKFLVQLETQMADIKSITMKSDEEMVDVRKNVVQQAVELKTSTGNVATVQASLYRQGLSDEDVRKNTAAVVKYAAVTGADVSTAMKNLTTAVQTGLVDNINTAMDVLVALGDTVATTAEQIAKGMQKSAAAAKNSGMSYEELATILAVGTTTTQLGGTQIGRATNSMLSRYSKVTQEGYDNSSDGTISINDVEAALATVNISTREDANTFRSFTDVLVDLSEVWDDLSDIQKSNISYAMAGTTQGNVFQSLMYGLSEGVNGKTFGELLEEAKNSAGTTDEKYEIKTDTIEYAVQEFNAALNACTENLFGLTDVVKGIINVATGLMKFFNTSDTSGGILSGGLAIAAIVGKVESPLAGIAIAAAAAGISAIVAGITTAIEHSTKEYKAEQENKSLLAETNAQVKLQQQTDEKITSINSVIETLDEKKSLKEQLSSSEFAYVEELFSAISNKFPEIGNSIDLATVSVEEFRAALNKATEANKEYITGAYLNSMKLVNLDAYKMEDYASPASGAEWKPIAEGGTSGTGDVSREDWQQLQDMFNKDGAYIAAAKDLFGDDYDMYSEQVTKVANLMYQYGNTYDFTDASNFGYNKKTGGTFDYAPGWSDSFKQFTADFFSPYKTAYETGETSIESKQKTYNDNMYVAETNVAGKIGLYSDYFDAIGLSDIGSDLTQVFIDEFGYSIAAWDEDRLNSEISSFINKRIIIPLENGVTTGEILNNLVEGKYMDENGNVYASTDVKTVAQMKRESITSELATATGEFKQGIKELLGDGKVITSDYIDTNSTQKTIDDTTALIEAGNAQIETYDTEIENYIAEIAELKMANVRMKNDRKNWNDALIASMVKVSAKKDELSAITSSREVSDSNRISAANEYNDAVKEFKDYQDNYYDDAAAFFDTQTAILEEEAEYEKTYGVSFDDSNRAVLEMKLTEARGKLNDLEREERSWNDLMFAASQGTQQNETYDSLKAIYDLKQNQALGVEGALSLLDYQIESEFGSGFDINSLESQASDLESTISELDRNIETEKARLESDEIENTLAPLDKDIADKKERLVQLLKNYYGIVIEYDEELGDYSNAAIQEAMDSIGLTEEMAPYRTKPIEGDNYTFIAKNYEASNLWYDIIPELEINREELFDSLTEDTFANIYAFETDREAAVSTLTAINETIAAYYEKYGATRAELVSNLKAITAERDAEKAAMESNGTYEGMSAEEAEAAYQAYLEEYEAQDALVSTMEEQIAAYDSIASKIAIANSLESRLGKYAGLKPEDVTAGLKKTIEDSRERYDTAVAELADYDAQIAVLEGELDELYSEAGYNLKGLQDYKTYQENGTAENNAKIKELETRIETLRAERDIASDNVDALYETLENAGSDLLFYDENNAELDSITTRLLDMMNGDADVNIASLQQWVDDVKNSGFNFNKALIDYIEDYIEKIENLEEELGMSDDELAGSMSKLYDITTGKRVDKTVQDYLSTSTGIFNFSEQQNKKGFANYLKKWKNLSEFYDAMINDQEKLTAFSSYISTEEFAKAVAAVEAGTQSYEDLVAAMMESAGSVSEASIFAADYINGISKNMENKLIADAIASGNYTAQQEQAFYTMTGITTPLSRENLMAAAATYSNTYTNEIDTTLKEKGVSLIQDIVGAADGANFGISKWNENTSIDEMLIDLKRAGVDISSYANAWNLLQAQGLTMGGIVKQKNSQAYYDEEDKTYYLRNYDKNKQKYYAEDYTDEETGNTYKAGTFYAQVQETDSNGNLLFEDTNGNKYRTVKYSNGDVGYISTDASIAESVKAEGDSLYIENSDGTKQYLVKNEAGNYISGDKTYAIQKDSSGNASFAVLIKDIVSEDVAAELGIDRKMIEQAVGTLDLSTYTASNIETVFGTTENYYNALIASAVDLSSYNVRAQETMQSLFASGASYSDIAKEIYSSPELLAYVQSSSELQTILNQLSSGAITAAEAFDKFNDIIGKTAQSIEQFKSSSRSLTKDLNKTQWYLDNKDTLGVDDKNYLAQLAGFSDYEDAVNNGFDIDKIVVTVEGIQIANKEKIVDNLKTQLTDVFRDAEGKAVNIKDLDTDVFDSDTFVIGKGTTVESIKETLKGIGDDDAEALAYQAQNTDITMQRQTVYERHDDGNGDYYWTPTEAFRYVPIDVSANAVSPIDYLSSYTQPIVSAFSYLNSDKESDKTKGINDLFTATDEIAAQNLAYNDTYALVTRLENGENLSEDEYESIASYLNTDVRNIKGNLKGTKARMAGRKQTVDNMNAEAQTKYYEGMATAIKNAGISFEELGVAEGDVEGLAESILANAEQYPAEVVAAAQAWDEVKNSISDTTTYTEKIDAAIASATSELDFKDAKAEMIGFTGTYEEFKAQLDDNKSWQNATINCTEYAEALAYIAKEGLEGAEALAYLQKALSSVNEQMSTAAINSIEKKAVSYSNGSKSEALEWYEGLNAEEQSVIPEWFIAWLEASDTIQEREALAQRAGFEAVNKYKDKNGSIADSEFSDYLYNSAYYQYFADNGYGEQAYSAQLKADESRKNAIEGYAEFLRMKALYEKNPDELTADERKLLQDYIGTTDLTSNYAKDFMSNTASVWSSRKRNDYIDDDFIKAAEDRAEEMAGETITVFSQELVDEANAQARIDNYEFTTKDALIQDLGDIQTVQNLISNNPNATDEQLGVMFNRLTSDNMLYGSYGLATDAEAAAVFDAIMSNDLDTARNLYYGNADVNSLSQRMQEIYGVDYTKYLSKEFDLNGNNGKNKETLAADVAAGLKNEALKEITRLQGNGTYSSKEAAFAEELVNGYNYQTNSFEENFWEGKAKTFDNSSVKTISGLLEQQAILDRGVESESAKAVAEELGVDTSAENWYEEAQRVVETNISDAKGSLEQFQLEWNMMSDEYKQMYLDALNTRQGTNWTFEDYENTIGLTGYSVDDSWEKWKNTSAYETTNEERQSGFYDMLVNAKETGASRADIEALLTEEDKSFLMNDASGEVGKIFREYINGSIDLSEALRQLETALNKGTRANNAFKASLRSADKEISNLQYYKNKGKDKWTTSDKNDIAEMMNYTSFAEAKKYGIDEDDLLDYINGELEVQTQDAMSLWNDKYKTVDVTVTPEMNVSMEPTVTVAAGTSYEDFVAMGMEEQMAKDAAYYSSLGYEITFDKTIETDDNGDITKVTYGMSDMKLTGTKSSGVKKSSGGGGGSEDKVAKKWKTKLNVDKHLIDMIQAQENRLQSAGKLTDYGNVLSQENKYQQAYINDLKKAIKEEKNHMSSLETNSDEWNTAKEQVYEWELAIESTTAAMEENNRKLKENQEAIRQTRITLEQTVREQIEARKQIEEDMLSGQVSLEDTILEAIKQRYQDESDLRVKNYEQQKEYLQKEKELLDERFNARKENTDRIQKEEELAELKRQYASISLDSTRSRERLELAQKIADMEREINEQNDQEMLEARTEAIDEQIAAYDDMIEVEQSDLEDFLSDANNMAEELNNILEMSQEDLLTWLEDNVNEFANLTNAAQEQMINSWTDTYEQYKHIINMWNDEIDNILSSKNRFLEYMKQADDYVNGDEETRASLLYQWEEQYDAFVNAYQDNNESFNHTDNFSGSSSSSSSSSSTAANTKATTDNTTAVKTITEELKKSTDERKADGTATRTSVDNAVAALNEAVKSSKTIFTPIAYNDESSDYVGYLTKKYATGGLVDYTGLAWVDGTPSEPEYVLSASQWKDLISNYTTPTDLMSYKYSEFSFDASALSATASTTVNVGDIIISTTGISNDADVEELANRIGEIFSNKINESGFSTSRFCYR